MSKEKQRETPSVWSTIKSAWKATVFVAVLAVLYKNYDDLRSLIYPHREPNIELKRRESVLQALLSIERNWARPAQAPVAYVGFGSCLDIFTSSKELFAKMGFVTAPEPKEFGVLHNREELLAEFGYYFKEGAAAERYVADRDLFERLVEAARSIKSTRSALGGNAPVIANRMAREGARVYLGGQAGDDLDQFGLHERLTCAGPKVKSSDIHLIVEYDKNEKFDNLVAPRANRFIVHADQYNPVLASYDQFVGEFNQAKTPPQLLVVGGLQMMEGYPYEEGERDAYFTKIRTAMASAAEETKTHFELASFVDETIMSKIKDDVLPYSDSVGMNEQELPNLLSLMKTGSTTKVAPAYPRVASVLDQMREIYELAKAEKWPRLMSRMHVHNIAFQAIMVRQGSGWRKTMTATAYSALVAHRHVCQTDDIDLANTRLLMDDSFSRSITGSDRVQLDPERPVSCWSETVAGDQFKICVSPVLVCTKVKQTAGGGDNITGAGLFVQI